MEKCNEIAVGTGARAFVDELKTGVPEASEFFLDVIDDKRNVMYSLSPGRNESHDRRFAIHRLCKLDA